MFLERPQQMQKTTSPVACRIEQVPLGTSYQPNPCSSSGAAILTRFRRNPRSVDHGHGRSSLSDSGAPCGGFPRACPCPAAHQVGRTNRFVPVGTWSFGGGAPGPWETESCEHDLKVTEGLCPRSSVFARCIQYHTERPLPVEANGPYTVTPQ